jgi:hypothetical protein
LKILVLSRPLVTDAGRKELQKGLPSCVIELLDRDPGGR